MNPALTEYPPYDHYPSPPAQSTSDQPTEWTTLQRDSWYYLLSEIALRRITNKICEHTVHNVPFDYFTTPSSLPTLLSLLPLTTELETQVRLWRDSLPTPMQFPKHLAPAVTEWRYFSQAEKTWTGTVGMITSMTVFPKADSWYMGANIPGRKIQMLNFPGGLPLYEQMCWKALETWERFVTL